MHMRPGNKCTRLQSIARATASKSQAHRRHVAQPLGTHAGSPLISMPSWDVSKSPLRGKYASDMHGMVYTLERIMLCTDRKGRARELVRKVVRAQKSSCGIPAPC